VAVYKGAGITYPVTETFTNTSPEALIVTRISLAATLLLALVVSFAPSGQARAQGEKQKDNDPKKQQVTKQAGEGDQDPEPNSTKYIRLSGKGYKKQEKLTANSPRDVGRRNALSKTYAIRFEKGKSYVFDLRSQAFDAYLRILDPNGQQVAYNDDWGGTLNSHIEYTAPTTGVYQVIASSLGGSSTGDYEFEAVQR